MYVLGSWLSWWHSAAACATLPIILALSLFALTDTPYSLFMQSVKLKPFLIEYPL